MTIDLTVFRQNLKKYRNKKGVGQREFAIHLRVGRGNIARYERGEVVPKLDVCIAIAQYLDISLDTLCGLTKKQDNELMQLISKVSRLSKDEEAALKIVLKKFVT